MMRLLVFPIFIFALGATKAFSCSCLKAGSILDRRDSSDLAIYGRLASETIDSAEGLRKMKFSWVKIWRQGKKTRARRIWVETPLESAGCGFEMPAGEKAILFLRDIGKKGRPVYETTLCSHNIVGPVKEQLDSLWQRKVPVKIKQ